MDYSDSYFNHKTNPVVKNTLKQKFDSPRYNRQIAKDKLKMSVPMLRHKFNASHIKSKSFDENSSQKVRLLSNYDRF